MKEELKALKDSTIKIAGAKEHIRKQTLFFNMKVEEQKEVTNVKELFNANDNSYEAARILNDTFPELYTISTNIRNDHPKYGDKRIKTLLESELTNIMIIDELPEECFEMIPEIIDNYLLYEACGYFNLRNKEVEMELMEQDALTGAKTILDESKQAAIKAKDGIVNIIKPYGEVAKGQLNDASKFTKEVLNKGSKKLIKILEKIENKTNNEQK